MSVNSGGNVVNVNIGMMNPNRTAERVNLPLVGSKMRARVVGRRSDFVIDEHFLVPG